MTVKVADFDLFNPKFRQDPYPYYELIRDTAPLYWLERVQAYAVSRYEDAIFVLKSPELFSSQRSPVGTIGLFENLRAATLNNTDPPMHTRLRNIVNRAFTPKQTAELEPRIREFSCELVEAMMVHEEFEFVEALGVPLPVTLIAEMLGVEPSRRGDFKRWSDHLISGIDVAYIGGDSTPVLQSFLEMSNYLNRIIEARRNEPRNDLVSLLVREVTGEDTLSAREMLALARLLLVAGSETTTNLLGNTLLQLLQHPSQLRWLAKNLRAIPAAIEEVLRFDSSVQTLVRVTTQDVSLASGSVPKGARVMVLLGAANRDPRKFPNPDRFDVRRDSQGQLAFGFGPHFCLGASLARLEARVVLEELLTRAPDLTFSPRQPQQIEWLPSVLVRGPKSLWLKKG